MARGSFGRSFKRLLILVAVVAVVVGCVAAFRTGPPPQVTITSEIPGIGKRTPVKIRVEEPKRGLAGFRVELVQGDRVELLGEHTFTPLEAWEFWGSRTPFEELTVDVGSETVKGLKEGDATVRVVAKRAGALLSNPDPVVQELKLPVRLKPPTLEVLSHNTYVDQGGCEAVVYRVGSSAVRDGVEAGKWWFPGFPLPGGGPQERFALFAVPYDMAEPSGVRLVAKDEVNNESRASFIDRFRPRPFKTDRIELSDEFIRRVVPAIYDQTPEITASGDGLADFLSVNGDLRRSNAATLAELAARSKPEFLWRQPFLPMRNAQVMSSFADRRTYVYQGRAVDQQDHLGFDLASTSRAEIQAANDGVVVLARYFGIYGNAVVIDHGYGLLTLYGHLSTIEVQEGESVARGDVVGRSGATGLAGGDHLHFTILLQGLPVNPAEWWDEHWIQDRLDLKLAAALPFE
jgi:murein DD-endopeptidase MepM/ murein hydrolase activator NlpD